MYVMHWEILFREFIHQRRTARRCKLRTTGQRTRPGCGNVAAGKPELHVEVARNETLQKANDHDNDHEPKWCQTQITTTTRTRMRLTRVSPQPVVPVG